MDTNKLSPILNKESILKTANSTELAQSPQDVLQRYTTYALTHVPLGDTTTQLNNLRRVVVENKTCAVGTIVGPYGYGKTSTAVHLWNEIRGQKILAVPPFLWTNLDQLMDAVYHWVRHEFSLGPQKFIPALESVYKAHRERYLETLIERLGNAEAVQELIDQGRLLLDIRASDIVSFFGATCQICEQAGYQGLIIFTDELQATLAKYSSRDKFFADLFDMVKDILGLPGHWALIISMDEATEGMISHLRLDLLQRLQRSALHFRVKEVYNRREYPAELWAAFEERFSFDGGDVILDLTLESIGEVAARSDLGAGPRMVTNAMALAIKHYEKTSQSYTPLHFVDDFLAGLMLFDQRGKFSASVKKALDNTEVRSSEPLQQVVKLLGAFPMGCSEEILQQFELLESFQAFPALARRELIAKQSGGYILRYLAEEEIPPEQIEQRLTKEFVGRFAPGRNYAVSAGSGFLSQVLREPIFNGWKTEQRGEQKVYGITYNFETLRGTFDPKFPDRLVNIMVAALSQSPAPEFEKANADAEFELRFELNYGIAPSEPSRLLVDPKCPEVAIFQLNLSASVPEQAQKILYSLLDFYAPDQITPLLCLSLIDYLYKNRGDLPDDQSRINTIMLNPLRQFSLTLLLGDQLDITNNEFATGMVGADRVKDIFRLQCRKVYPDYRTLVMNRNWQAYLQQYRYALQKITTEDGISIVRGRHDWTATKDNVADTFHVANRKMTALEVLIDSLCDCGLLEKVQFSGRTTASEVTLRFKIHPLEDEWLRKLDASRQKIPVNGDDALAIPAQALLHMGKKAGYTDLEIQEVIRLMIDRRFIDKDQHHGMIVRIVDQVSEIQEITQGLVEKLEQDIQAVQEALPEFDDRLYPIAKLRDSLASAKERDEFENIRNEIRRLNGSMNAFVSTRTASLREKLRQEQEQLHNLVRQGLPMWLNYSFDPNPLFDLLERQRSSLVSAYQAVLDEIRRLRDASVRSVQEISGSNIEIATRTYDLLRDFTDKSQRQKTRLQSYQDQKEDMEAWQQAAKMAADVDARAQSIAQVYSYAEFNEVAALLWKSLKNDFEADPLSILSKHIKAREQIAQLNQRMITWIENRRSDFEQKCQGYQTALGQAGIHTELRIPFDQEHPSESVEVLLQQVQKILEQHLGTALWRINQALVTIRYSVKVQHLDLSSAETQAQETIGNVTQLKSHLNPDGVRELEMLQRQIIQPLVALHAREQQLYITVQKAVQVRPAEGAEIPLLDLLNQRASERQIDLRGLIIGMIEQGTQDVDLDALMDNLQALFQKNQIEIYVNIVSPEGKR